MSILLDKEERKELFNQYYNQSKLFGISYEEYTNRAQLKKMYKWLEDTKVEIDSPHNHRFTNVVFDYQWRAEFKKAGL